MPTSRLPGIYHQTLAERLDTVAEAAGLTPDEQARLAGGRGLDPAIADGMIESVLGVYGLPYAVATNLVVNAQDRLVPMVIEEPSVVAGLSFAGRLVREGGGFAGRL